MDPNANLKEQIELAKEIRRLGDSDKPIRGYLAELDQAADRLADLVIALDEWISKGGFLPEKWQNA